MNSCHFENIQYFKKKYIVYIFQTNEKTHKLWGEGDFKKHITMYLFTNELSNCPW